MTQVEAVKNGTGGIRALIAALLLGFSSGLPLLSVGSTLQAWMTDAKVDLGVIGLYAFVGLPYTLKFLWAPIFDRFSLPFLGKRRGWIVVWQLGLVGAFLVLSSADPKRSLWLLAAASLLVTFLSASQDIVIDAWRREILTKEQLALGSSLGVTGYRIAMLVSGAFALYLADHIPWPQVYQTIAVIMLVCIPVTLFVAEEPFAPPEKPRSIYEVVVAPLGDFLTRPGAMAILLFIVCYKLGDIVAASISTPYFMSLGFAKSDIGFYNKAVGLVASIVGGLVGGGLTVRIGINRALWLFGLAQACSILVPLSLTVVGPSAGLLAASVAAENVAFGMGMSAYTAFMADQTNRRYSGTQLALLTSLMGIPRVILSSPAGYLQKVLDWRGFFILCIALCLPGMLLLLRVAPWNPEEKKAAPVKRIPLLDTYLAVFAVGSGFMIGVAAGAWTTMADGWNPTAKVLIGVAALANLVGVGMLWERNPWGLIIVSAATVTAASSTLAGLPTVVPGSALSCLLLLTLVITTLRPAFPAR